MRERGWAVLFDVDGTMVDNRAYHEQAWIELGRRRGLPITPEFYRRHIHSRPNDLTARLLLGRGVDLQEAERLAEEKEALYRELYRPVMREIPGLTRLLQELAAAGVACAAVSNSPRENVDMVLDGLHVRGYFAEVLHVGDVRRGKPDPEMLLAAADRLAVPPAHCVLLEDSISGFRAAEAAGMPYVVITAGADPEELEHAVRARALHRDFSSITVEELRSYAAPLDTQVRSEGVC